MVPFFGASLMGKRGFAWGILFVTISFFLLLALFLLGIEMYPFQNSAHFQREFMVNLFIFTFLAIYYTYYHVNSEDEYLKTINAEVEKNETLLRILFHDLANPMQTVKTASKKLRRLDSIEDCEKYAQMIERSTERILETLENVRKLRAIKDKKLIYDIAPHSLTTCLKKVEEMFMDKLREKQIQLKIVGVKGDLTFSIDESFFIHQIMGNILSNAIKFSSPNSEVQINFWEDGEKVYIKIRDFGIGIPSEIMSNIFHTSSHISRKGTLGEIGTGYGLNLAKSFVEEFHGELRISSQVKSNITNSDQSESGTTVTLIFPLQLKS